ncbi:MAG: hypothetical protein JO115_11535 [Pseudonocardiales bacterium]|nr:hypothetical protein [Pseudonocardiales bacterium]
MTRPVESIYLLGTTWYTRGTSYWARRAALSLLYLALAVGCGAMTTLIVSVVWKNSASPGAFKVTFTVIVAACVVGSGVVTARAYSRAEAGVRAGRIRRATGTLLGVATGLVGLARLTVLGVLVLAGSFFIGTGGMVVTFAYSLKHEFFGERQAHLREQRNQHRRRDGPIG